MTSFLQRAHARSVLLALFIAGIPAHGAQDNYQVTRLGTEDFSEAFAINDRGEVALRTAVASTGLQTAVVYRDQMRSLISNLPGSTSIFPSAINQLGHVAGTSFFPNDPGSRGFLYDQATTRDLGIWGGGTSTNIMGINDTDGLVGNVSFPSGTRAFMKIGSVITELVGFGGPQTRAADINNFGQIVGHSTTSTSENPLHGFLYSAGTMTDLFVATGGIITQPLAINDAGVMVGRSSTNAPFIYKNGVATLLNTGGAFSAANGLNDYDEVVGSAQLAIDSSRAFFHSPGKGMVYLNDEVILGDGVAPGFTSLETATGINNRGWIIGQGYYFDGATLSLQAFLLIPKNPASSPTCTVAAGTYHSPQAVMFSTSTPGAVIRYTTDGRTPTAVTGTVYNGFFVVSETTTVRAVAFGSGFAESPVTAIAITIVPPSQTLDHFTLLNADTGQLVPGFEPLQDGAVIDLATLPTRRIAIRANTVPETVGSVRFAFAGKTNFRTETDPPYALWGDTNGTYTPATPAPGVYTLTGTPYTGAGATGTVGTPLTIHFTVKDSSISDTLPPSVPSKLTAEALAPTSVTVRWNASTDNVGVTGYEVFQNGVSKGLVTSTSLSLTGLAPSTTYSVAVRARDAAGNWSKLTSPLAITTLANPTLSVAGVTLINADTDLPIPGYDPIVTGAVIPRASLPTTHLNLLVKTSPAIIGSVKLKLDNTTKTETLAPYAYFGDTDGDYNAGTISNGKHVLTATPYSGANATGTAGTPLTVTFTIK